MTKTSNKMSGITNNNNNNNNSNNNINKLSEKFLSTNKTKTLEASSHTLSTGVNTTTNNNNNNNAISHNNPKSNNNNDCDKITQQQFSATISSKLQAPQTRRSLPAPSAVQTLAQRSLQQQQQQSVTTNSSVLPSANPITKYSNGATLPSHQLQTIATVHQHHPPQQQQQHTAEPTTTGTTTVGISSDAQQQQSHPKSLNSAKDKRPHNHNHHQQHQHHPQHQPHHHSQQQQQQTVSKHLTGEIEGTSSIINGITLQQQRNAYNLQALKAANHLKAPAHSIPPRYQPPPQPAGNQAGILKHINTLRSGGAESAETFGQRQSATGGSKQLASANFDTTHFNLKYPPDIPQLSPVYIPDSLKLNSGSARYLPTQQTSLAQRQTARLAGGATNPQYFYNTQQHQQQYRQQQAEQQQQQQQQHQQDMLKFVRKSDQDHPSPNASITSSAAAVPTGTTRLTAEQNRQLQGLINELRVLKEQNQRLLDDNQELRDLCCFLDDDRQKGRKLAREWQRFGRYTASVMRQEVAAYQHKLRQLDDKQQELITDNLELKELCLYLDEERTHIAANALCANCGSSVRNPLRDDGDGSSSSTNAEETLSALRNYERQMPEATLRTTLSDQTVQYVRSLERRIRQLEEERVGTTTPTSNILATQHNQTQAPTPQTQQHQQQQQQQSQQQPAQNPLIDPISSRPEAVVRALQVLEVREQLERDRLSGLIENSRDQMDDGEKALVREMCNVVWRKLESNVPNVSSSM
nr:putative mediator of RNA polymerase II transcription subunit 26 [Bactrocera oleae]XP_036225963.1 putative mediator of RNA polymerase II transcription subunit 26 [Bactrocera oleae]XP_036225964.1 putative mediator of RNA polymerase II transcription subunit 26 [Bactrocera oleae]XP_036225965.1 putative mediator of RNA polymerase II transcription subunit 26 [Bactrocera oleae]XP_036225966.1 putative mediator of RNA polymerase II transcription subunit 26 [Bactrocera oleae]